MSVYALDASKKIAVKQQAYNQLTGILSTISEDDDICMQGDFNASVITPNSNTSLLSNFIDTHELHIMPNNLPTYIGPVSTTTIDHFLLSPSLLPYLTHHYVSVSPATVTHPPSDHRCTCIQLYATATPPPSLDTILPSPPQPATLQKYNVANFKQQHIAAQYIDCISNAYEDQCRNNHTDSNESSDAAHTTKQQMTEQLQGIIHTAAAASIGHITQRTAATHLSRHAHLLNNVQRQYHRHQRAKSTLSWSRYMAAQDKLTMQMQMDVDKRYYKLMDDVSAAVSTFQHDRSVWWKWIERIVRPAQQQQHMTRLQMQQKVIAMKQHQEQLLRPHTALDDQLDNEWFAHVNDFMAHDYQLLPLASDHRLVSRITLVEVQGALKLLHNGKHPGHDNILNEMLKYGGEALHHMLLQLFNQYMKHQYTPEPLWHAQIMMLPKNNNDANDMNNYRGISFLSTIAKLYETILYWRLQPQVSDMLHVQQAGFTHQRGCPEQIFTLMECASFRYYHQFKSTYILFCDLAKAYDSVWRNGLYYKMIHEFNVPPHFVNIIMQIYSSVQCCILYEGVTSTTFTAYKGLLQGSVLSPLLFNLYINELVGTLHDGLTGVMYGYSVQWTDRHDNDRTIEPYKVATTFFADDFTTINCDAKGVKHSIQLIYQYNKRWRLTLNCDKGKTEVLVMYCMPSDEKYQQWQTPNGDVIHRTKQYTYLGVQLTEHADAAQYITKRLQASHNAMGKLHSAHVLGSKVTLECRVELYKSIILPILNYGSEVMTYGSTTSFNQLCNMIDKRHHIYVKQLLQCRSKSAAMDWCFAETGLKPIIYHKATYIFSFFARMSLADKHIPAQQIYDRMCVMRHQAQPGRHNNCKDPYQSWYHKHLEDLAKQFDINLQVTDMKWLNSVKKQLNRHWSTTWLSHIQSNDSTWSTIYSAFKHQPIAEPYMLSLKHSVTTSLHKLRSSHFPFQRHIGRISNTDTTCTLCHAAEEDIAHFLLHCTAYKHRRALHKQIQHVKQHYNVHFQHEVDMYFSADLPDVHQCAHLLSRTLPAASTSHKQSKQWQAMWFTIFHKLDAHLHILVSKREAMLRTATINQLHKAIKHNSQYHR